MKSCSNCGVEKPEEKYAKKQNYCRDCQRAYMAGWRKANRERLLEYGRTHRAPLNLEYQREYQKRRVGSIKVKARQIANLAFKDDARVRECADCGTDTNVDKAHVDYMKPLVVVPLCRIHHRMFDSDPEYRARFEGRAVCAQS